MARLIIWLIILGTAGVVFFINSNEESDINVVNTNNSVMVEEKLADEGMQPKTDEILPKNDAVIKQNDPILEPEENVLPSFVKHDVPFTPQAPLGDWSDQRFQDGCEEASMIMAKHWITNQELTPHIATQEIIKLSKWEQERFGTYRDTSADDTQTTLFEYFGIDASVSYNLSIQEIKEQLFMGSIILVPSNGALLNNPYFTSPPEHHMLVIIGYDDKKSEFITNDPGTKRGSEYRYSYSTIKKAAQDYPTGDHLEPGERNPTYIIISPQ